MTVPKVQTLLLNDALQQAITYHQTGQLQEAEQIYRAILQACPIDPIANHNLGMIAVQFGQHSTALPYLKNALFLDSTQGQYALSYADALLATGQANEALLIINAAIKRGFNTTGTRELKQKIETAIKYPPIRNTEIPASDLDHFLALFKTEQYSVLESCVRSLLDRYPDSGTCWKVLGASLMAQSKNSLFATQKAAKLLPNDAESHFNLGNSLREHSQFENAITSYQRALEINPNYVNAHLNLGIMQQKIDLTYNAIESYRKAMEIDPTFVAAYSNCGTALQSLGLIEEAATWHRRAMEINPNSAKAHSDLIFTLDLAAKDPIEFQFERKNWDRIHATPLQRFTSYLNDATPSRRLRIGYVSADFVHHSAVIAFGNMLTLYNREQFDVYAYSNLNLQEDHFTRLFKHSVTVWRDILRVSDEAVAEQIHNDKIDILIDLSSHSGGNRLLIFARKPAPIQITAWGYGTSTGMRAIDYFFADPIAVPPQEKEFFTENVRYLPCIIGSFFNDPFPDINPLPALTNGIVTFGSFNRLTKISDETYQAWVKILLAVPQSKLILKAGDFNEVATRERVINYFVNAGISADRIILIGKTLWSEHVQAFNKIDIALDPFPHCGGVSTLEGLIMGVPVITLKFNTIIGRTSSSVMTALNLPDWIAETPNEYIELAVSKASNISALSILRQQLRSIYNSSALGDSASYVRTVEQEYRQLWQEWCESQSH